MKFQFFSKCQHGRIFNATNCSAINYFSNQDIRYSHFLFKIASSGGRRNCREGGKLLATPRVQAPRGQLQRAARAFDVIQILEWEIFIHHKQFEYLVIVLNWNPLITFHFKVKKYDKIKYFCFSRLFLEEIIFVTCLTPASISGDPAFASFFWKTLLKMAAKQKCKEVFLSHIHIPLSHFRFLLL